MATRALPDRSPNKNINKDRQYNAARALNNLVDFLAFFCKEPKTTILENENHEG